MASMTRSELLLHTLCDLVEDPTEAARLRALDPATESTFAEVYCAVRKLPTLTDQLRSAFIAEIFEQADRETERQLEAKSTVPSQRVGKVIPLRRRAGDPARGANEEQMS